MVLHFTVPALGFGEPRRAPLACVLLSASPARCLDSPSACTLSACVCRAPRARPQPLVRRAPARARVLRASAVLPGRVLEPVVSCCSACALPCLLCAVPSGGCQPGSARLLSYGSFASAAQRSHFMQWDRRAHNLIKHAPGIACFNGVPNRASASHAWGPRARVSLPHVHS